MFDRRGAEAGSAFEEGREWPLVYWNTEKYAFYVAYLKETVFGISFLLLFGESIICWKPRKESVLK